MCNSQGIETLSMSSLGLMQLVPGHSALHDTKHKEAYTIEIKIGKCDTHHNDTQCRVAQWKKISHKRSVRQQPLSQL